MRLRNSSLEGRPQIDQLSPPQVVYEGLAQPFQIARLVRIVAVLDLGRNSSLASKYGISSG